MISEVISLLNDEYYAGQLRSKLPFAFEVAEAECRRIQMRKGTTHETTGQEVGLLREKVLVAFLRHTLGDMHITLPSANTSMLDVLVFGKPLEVKTATENGGVKAKWTADADSAMKDISGFKFSADLLLARIRIWWGQDKEGLFYIPVEVLQEVGKGVDPSGFLSGAAGTNNRGIEFKRWFMKNIEQHPNTIRLSIPWVKSGINIDPMERWLKYWASIADNSLPSW